MRQRENALVYGLVVSASVACYGCPMLPQTLQPIEVRVLGSLIEKELSTPDHYPLSLNALTSACNQTTNRDPVMRLEENAVSGAIGNLRRMNLVRSFQAGGSRVPKYQHLLADAAELSRPELALLCVLTLRGPQTLGELRSRAARLLPGDDPDAIENALNTLMGREPPVPVTRLSRKAGQKEARYAHLLGGDVVDDTVDTPLPGAPAPALAGRMAALEEITSELRKEVADLREELATFRKQFE